MTSTSLGHDVIKPYTGEPVITGYAQGRGVLEDERWTARPAQADALLKRLGPPGLDTPQALLAALYTQLLFAEEETHQRLRNALDGPLARRTRQLLPFIQQTVRELVAAAERQGEIDLEEDFARPLAIRTLAHLLGWPSDKMKVTQLATWASSVIEVTTGYTIGQVLPKVQEMAAAFRALVVSRQAMPSDDLASDMARSPHLESDTERVVLLMVLLSAGTSTTITALVNGLPLIIADPERLAALRADLAADRKTLSRLVDEVLRLVTPTQYVRRWSTADLTVGETPVPAGCPVQVQLAAMNQDQACFTTPGLLDWQRPATSAHAAFGFGVHACPGAPLARMELRTALEALLALPGLHLERGETHWNTNRNQRRLHGVRLRVLRKETADASAAR